MTFSVDIAGNAAAQIFGLLYCGQSTAVGRRKDAVADRQNNPWGAECMPQTLSRTASMNRTERGQPCPRSVRFMGKVRARGGIRVKTVPIASRSSGTQLKRRVNEDTPEAMP